MARGQGGADAPARRGAAARRRMGGWRRLNTFTRNFVYYNHNPCMDAFQFVKLITHGQVALEETLRRNESGCMFYVPCNKPKQA